MIKIFRFLLVLILSNGLYSQTYFTNEGLNKVRDVRKHSLQSHINTNKPFSFKDIGFGLEVYSGYIFYTGSLNENYTNYAPVGLAIYLRYKTLDISVRNAIGFNKTKTEFDYSSETLDKGYRLISFLAELSLNYEVYHTNRIKLSPFLGIGSISLNPIREPSEQSTWRKDPLLKSKTYNFGVNFDIKRGSKNNNTAITFVRIRYGFGVQRPSGNSQNNTGNIHYLTIGYCGIL